MLKEFKDFIVRGNVLDMAVGVVIGGAFTTIVNKVVDGLITPLIGLIVTLITGTKSLDSALSVLDMKFHGVTFQFSSVISAVITFLITGFVLFLVVKAANRAKELGKKKEVVEEETAPAAEDYLREIRDLLAEQNEKKS